MLLGHSSSYNSTLASHPSRPFISAWTTLVTCDSDSQCSSPASQWLSLLYESLFERGLHLLGCTSVSFPGVPWQWRLWLSKDMLSDGLGRLHQTQSKNCFISGEIIVSQWTQVNSGLNQLLISSYGLTNQFSNFPRMTIKNNRSWRNNWVWLFNANPVCLETQPTLGESVSQEKDLGEKR